MKEAFKVSFTSDSYNQHKEPLPKVNDRDLWNSLRAGSNAAFITIYNRMFNSLYAYGMRINRSEPLVQDAIHDVFYELKKNCKRLGETDSIKFYLFKCLKRKILKEVKNWNKSHMEIKGFESFEITFSQEHNLINQQIDLEKSEMINKAISGLSSRKKEAIYYIFYEGLNYKQVAELMGLADSKSARDLTYKALKVLREELGFLPLIFIVNPLIYH